AFLSCKNSLNYWSDFWGALRHSYPLVLHKSRKKERSSFPLAVAIIRIVFEKHNVACQRNRNGGKSNFIPLLNRETFHKYQPVHFSGQPYFSRSAGAYHPQQSFLKSRMAFECSGKG